MRLSRAEALLEAGGFRPERRATERGVEVLWACCPVCAHPDPCLGVSELGDDARLCQWRCWRGECDELDILTALYLANGMMPKSWDDGPDQLLVELRDFWASSEHKRKVTTPQPPKAEEAHEQRKHDPPADNVYDLAAERRNRRRPGHRAGPRR